MKIRELSDVTGVTVATLKYYLREGLLHGGAATAVNQADYDESHVRRVRLVRALLQLGRLSIADAQLVLAAVDDDSIAIHDAFAVAQDAMVPARDRSGPQYAAALDEVVAFVRRHRLQVRPDAHVLEMLADAVVTMDDLGFSDALGTPRLASFDGLLEMALPIAEFEVASTRDDITRAEQMEYTVIGTITFEVAYAALRRMALEHASAIRFGSRRKPRRTD
ncbi:MAG: MerR family transcriptional regulator [Actinomycetia bacterium]|nr:MerR family transcriptional regulator [Actinomycetes bacterium]